MRIKTVCTSVFFKFIFVCISAFLLAGCSSGDDSASSNGSPTPTPVNAALMTNNAIATASANTLEEHYIHDGNITTTNAWTASNANDFITVMFSRTYAITHFTLHLTSTIFSTDDLDIQTTVNGTTFTTLNLIGGDCPTLSMGSGQIACTFPAARNISGMRVVITAGKYAANTLPLYELIATGT